MPSNNPKISDFGKHSNAKPRLLGEVKAESVCFDFLNDNNPLIVGAFQTAGEFDKRQLIMNKLHENLITTALIADVSNANINAHQPTKKNSNATSPALGSSFSAVHLLSSLVSPRPRSISIPKPRNSDFPGYYLRIDTASNIPDEMDGVDVYDPQGEARIHNGQGHIPEWQQKNSSRNSSNWGDYRRQLSTAKKKELTRKLSQVSKCEAVDIMDPVQGTMPHYSSPMIILSQPQRDEENELLNAAAEMILQRSRNISAISSARCNRSRAISREARAFSHFTKKENGQQETGHLPEGIIGRNIDNGFGLAPDNSFRDDVLFTGRAAGSSGLWRRHVSYQNRAQPPKDRPGSKTKPPSEMHGYSLKARSAKSIADGLFKLQGKSLPRLPKQNSYTENLRLLQKKKQNGNVPPDFHNYERLQQQQQMSESQTNKFWTIPEGSSDSVENRKIANGFRPPRKIPTKLPPYNETIHAHNLTYTRTKTPTYKTYRENLSPRRGIKNDKNSQNGEPSNDKDSDVQDTFRLTELKEDDIVDVDSEGYDLTDTDEDEKLDSIRFCGEDLTRQPLEAGKYQGTTSRISEDEMKSQFHLVNGEKLDVQQETYKILKALDKDVYFDYEHKKYRRTGATGSLGNLDNPRVHFLKVRVNKSLT